MNWYPSRALVPAGLLIGLTTACAHGRSGAPRPSQSQPSGSIVTAEDIERSPSQSIEDILMSRVPGLWVVRTRDGIALRVRGPSTLLGDKDPLYVLDGIPIQAGTNGVLTGINPYDIASIEVLKDAASLASYGARGAGGVIVIKTKRPPQ